MSNDQPSPYSTAAVEATVDHLRARIRELEADLSTARRERDAYRDSASLPSPRCVKDLTPSRTSSDVTTGCRYRCTSRLSG